MTLNPTQCVRPRFTTLAAIILATSLAGHNAHAQEPRPPEALTWMVLNEINGAYFDRAEPMNRPALVTQVPQGMIRAVNVSDDGRPDWLVDYSERGSTWCGTGGCLQTLYVSDGDQYVMAFDAQALNLQIGRSGSEARLEAQVHHLNCVPETQDCRFAWTWHAEAMRLVERPNSQGQTHLTEGGFDPLENDRDVLEPRDDMPPGLAETWWGTRVICPAYVDAGTETRRAEVHDVPDLNGDGVRDWLFQMPPGCQQDPDGEVPTPGFLVWLSQPDGSARMVYESQRDRWPAVDIASSPAFLIDNPSCGYGVTCPNQRLRWDAAAGRFR